MKQLLPEQAAAAYEITKNISVTAGPGSGKTTVLVARYLHILRTQKLNIDQIVAITFTNRAANEMRERLRHDLAEILQTAPPLPVADRQPSRSGVGLPGRGHAGPSVQGPRSAALRRICGLAAAHCPRRLPLSQSSSRGGR